MVYPVPVDTSITQIPAPKAWGHQRSWDRKTIITRGPSLIVSGKVSPGILNNIVTYTGSESGNTLGGVMGAETIIRRHCMQETYFPNKRKIEK